jgi:hypothetical protein
VQVAETTQTVEERLAALEQAVTDVGRQVSEAVEESAVPAELSVIPGLELRHPIPILLEESAEDAVARWVEPHLWGIGRNGAEAIASLREELCTVWHDLESASDSQLSQNTRTMRAIMRRYVKSAS